MPKQPPLPVEVHDHFRKANVLHGYVEKSLEDAKQQALETGAELMAAKAATPPKRWESECDRLFDGSLRTARFYMQFSRDMEALPKRQRNAVLMLEGSLVGAAKAAREAAKPKSASAPGHGDEEPPGQRQRCAADPAADSAGKDDRTEAPGMKPETTGSRGRGKRQGKPAAPVDREARLTECKLAISDANKLVRKVAKEIDAFESHWHEEVTRSLVTAAQDVTAWLNNWPAPKPEDNDTIVPPEREWVEDHIRQKLYGFTVDEFFDYYEPRGWKPNKSTTKARKWKPLCSTFERNRKRWATEKKSKPSGRHHENTPLE